LVRRSRVLWATADGTVLLSCQVSKRFDTGKMDYWFGLKRTTKEPLESHPNSYVAFGMGSASRVVLLPFKILQPYLRALFTSPDKHNDVLHWHVRFKDTDSGIDLLTNKDRDYVDITPYLLETTN